MHDALRQRLLRKIESLPDEQIYQVLDFIEFLESKYTPATPAEATGLQRFAEGLEDRLRRRAVSPSTIREAFQLISAADRVLSGVSSAGKQIIAEVNAALEATPEEGEPGASPPARAIPPVREEGRRPGSTPERGDGGDPPLAP